MKQLTGTTAELTFVNKAISDSFIEQFGTDCINYSEIYESDGVQFILIDENDLREPIKILSQSQVNRLKDFCNFTETN